MARVDHRLGGTHPLGELALARPRRGAKVVDQFSESEVLLDASAHLSVWPLTGLADVVPARVVGDVGCSWMIGSKGCQWS